MTFKNVSGVQIQKPIKQPKEGSKLAQLRAMRAEKTKRPTAKQANVAKLKAAAGLSASAEPPASAPPPPKPVETTVSKPSSKKTAKARARTAVKGKTEGVREGTKLALVVGLLTRPEGCTTADVLKATKWPSVSMPAQAKAAGLKLKKAKEGRAIRYHAA